MTEDNRPIKRPPSSSGSDVASSSEDERPAPAPKQKQQETIPDAVDHFLGRLLDSLQKKNLKEVNELYEETYNTLSDRHYKNSRWPSAESVRDTVSEQPLFIYLYKELYYRHLFSRLDRQSTFDDRKTAWTNYCLLLELIIEDLQSEDTSLAVPIPPTWLWDMLDEFVYNFQTFSTYRNKMVKANRDSEIRNIRDNPDIFDSQKVLSFLHQLIQFTLIEEYLQSGGKNPDGKRRAFTDESTRLCGYFSIMQLLRVHSLLGDYRLALKAIEHVDFRSEVPLFYKIAACHITLFYYMGFAYIMLRRYTDAIRAFSDILVYLNKSTGMNELSYQYEYMKKRQDQMYSLVLVCNALSPQQLDESVDKVLKDRFAERLMRLQRGDDGAFEEVFNYACPKFISAAPPDFDTVGLIDSFNIHEAPQRQLELFKQEVKQQRFLPTIRSYMKLYTAINVSKLAQLCEMDEEALRDQLMCVMHKTRQPVRAEGGPPLGGEVAPCSDVDFYLDADMVHINARRPQKPHADVFYENILKYQDILKKMGKA